MARPLARRRSAAADLPERIPPQLTQLVEAAPEGDDWLHKIKFDGYRMHARLDRSAVRLLTRTGLDWTHKYSPIAAAVSALGARQAYLDGELCGVFPDGITSFSMIPRSSPLPASPTRPPVSPTEATLDPPSRGSRLDADHPENGVLIPRRFTSG